MNTKNNAFYNTCKYPLTHSFRIGVSVQCKYIARAVSASGVLCAPDLWVCV